MAASARKLPRPFEFPFGRGQIVEEVSYEGEHHVPTVQLLEWEDGRLSLRFCSYTHAGRFQRNPLVVSESDLTNLGRALDTAPRLKRLLHTLTA